MSALETIRQDVLTKLAAQEPTVDSATAYHASAGTRQLILMPRDTTWTRTVDVYVRSMGYSRSYGAGATAEMFASLVVQLALEAATWTALQAAIGSDTQDLRAALKDELAIWPAELVNIILEPGLTYYPVCPEGTHWIVEQSWLVTYDEEQP